KSGHRLAGGIVRTDSDQNYLCRGSADTGLDSSSQPEMSTQSAELLHRGCALAGRTRADFKHELGWTDAGVTKKVCDQGGVARRRLHREALKLASQLDTRAVP